MSGRECVPCFLRRRETDRLLRRAYWLHVALIITGSALLGQSVILAGLAFGWWS